MSHNRDSRPAVPASAASATELAEAGVTSFRESLRVSAGVNAAAEILQEGGSFRRSRRLAV